MKVARVQLLERVHSYFHLMADRQLNPKLRQKIGESDVAQQSVTMVIENFDQFRGQTNQEFQGWLKTILSNEVKKTARHFNLGKRDIGREKSLDYENNDSQKIPPPRDLSPSPESHAMVEEKIRRFHKLLDRLPSDYAEVIRLRSLERLPLGEVAEKMGRSYDATSKLWYRAIMKLEEQIGQEDESI